MSPTIPDRTSTTTRRTNAPPTATAPPTISSSSTRTASTSDRAESSAAVESSAAAPARFPVVRLCLMVEGQNGVTWDQWLALADAAERSGLEGLFRSDHYTSMGDEPGALDAWATLAALAARTSRIRLGTMVSPVTFRHPSVLAKMVVTVDHVSGGRAELGLGAGWHEGEHRAYGFEFPPTPTRMERLAEQLELVTRSWTEDAVSFQGRHYRVQDLRALPKPVQRPRPTLLVGGGAGPKSLALAARFADEYNTVG